MAGVFLGSPQLSIQQPESHRSACDLQGSAGPDPSASPASPLMTALASSPHTCLPTCFRPWKHIGPSLPWAPKPLTHTPPSGFSLKSTSSGKPATGSKEDQVPCTRLSLNWCFSWGWPPSLHQEIVCQVHCSPFTSTTRRGTETVHCMNG